MMNRSLLHSMSLICTFWSLLLCFSAYGQTGGKGLVILANKNMPESIELANYYAQKRGISTNAVCLLDLPVTEDMSRAQYEKRLRVPLLKFLRQGDFIRQVEREIHPPLKERAKLLFRRVRGKLPEEGSLGVLKIWETVETSVHFVVPVYGVPLRIAGLSDRVGARVNTHQENLQRKTIAAVDSELALCLIAGHQLEGSFRNPVYNSVSWSDGGGSGAAVMICSRLDGPSPDVVRRMIDQSIQCERYGIQGNAYVDARGIKNGGYFSGDYWLRSAYDRIRQKAYDVSLDSKEELFGETYPMEQAGLYLGWYAEHVAGPFLRDDFQFAPGAVAYHLHSGAAATLRSDTEHWAGPLLARGAVATMGAVHEPYLRMTIDLDIFTHRLTSGYTFGESAYMALPVLSWQMAIIGDPLYRPFGLSLDQQIANMEEDEWPLLEYGYARKTLQLVHDGFFNIGLNYAREKIEATNSLVLRELLAKLYLKNNLAADAAIQFEYVAKNATSPITVIRVVQQWSAVLQAVGDESRAEMIREDVRQRWPGHPALGWLNGGAIHP